MKKSLFTILAALFFVTASFSFFPAKKADAIVISILDYYTYDQAKKDGTPVTGKHSEKVATDTDRSLPLTGEKLSSKDFIKNGKKVQRRYYDDKGRADEDIDYDHSNGDKSHTFPHRHKWVWPDGSGPPKRLNN